MKFGFIATHRGVWPAGWLCEALGVSRGGFYDWLKRPESQRSRDNRHLTVQIRTSFEQSDQTYGSPRVWRDLRAWGYRCGVHRVARLMRQVNLRPAGITRLRSTRGKSSVPMPNLLRQQFTVTQESKAWVTDITYIRTWQGWLYLAVVMDLFSRRSWAGRPAPRFSASWCSMPS